MTFHTDIAYIMHRSVHDPLTFPLTPPLGDIFFIFHGMSQQLLEEFALTCGADIQSLLGDVGDTLTKLN